MSGTHSPGKQFTLTMRKIWRNLNF
jgi:hypothetical protein